MTGRGASHSIEVLVRLLDVPLVDIEISNSGSVMPDDIVTFLCEADLRVSQFLRNRPLRATGFVPSDFKTAYHIVYYDFDDHIVY